MDERPFWISCNALCGHIAMWAVRQSPYDCPAGLERVLAEFRERTADRQDAKDIEAPAKAFESTAPQAAEALRKLAEAIRLKARDLSANGERPIQNGKGSWIAGQIRISVMQNGVRIMLKIQRSTNLN